MKAIRMMSRIAMVVFMIISISVLTAGLLSYENTRSGSRISGGATGSGAGGPVILTSLEVAKHNTSADCWVIISGKVYNVTGYMDSHPGGGFTELCGKDATEGFMTKGKTPGSPHSASADTIHASLYLGDLNSAIQPGQPGNVPGNGSATPGPAPGTGGSGTGVPVTVPAGTISLTPEEVAKHGTAADCWVIISGKVYDVTSYMGAHPGGSFTQYCGIDATTAFMTKGGTPGTPHSASADTIHASLYLGDLNSSIPSSKVGEVQNATIPSRGRGDDDEHDDD